MTRRSALSWLGVWLTALICAAGLALAWWLPNRPQAGDVPMPDAMFQSVSFAPFRAEHSPLSQSYPSVAQVEEDMALVATRARGIRTYASLEGHYDIAEIAARHGLRLWQGAWLGTDRVRNEAELAKLIETANRHPQTVERVVVGNEVLLRRDLPPAELIAAIDRVKAAVRQPVTYADVWEFWEQFPEVADHVDVITIHILPYWEDHPTNVEDAVAHTRAIVQRMRARFPDKPLAIGEVGWPSAGRWRQDAAPSLVNQAVFVREFIALARQEGLDYNLIEAFDQIWKYRSEGTVGANWGLWNAARQPKFPLSGPVEENPRWRIYALASILLGAGLSVFFARRRAALRAVDRMKLTALSFACAGALTFAWAGTVPLIYDLYLGVAAAFNLAGQALLALLLLLRAEAVFAGTPVPPARTGAQATALLRALVLMKVNRTQARNWRAWALDDIFFIFLWTATLLQLLLLFDPRYRDFPLPVFAMPLLVVAARAWLRDLPLEGGGREELWLGGVLAAAAVASAVLEGPKNTQALVWNAAALVLAASALLRVRRRAPPSATFQ